MKKWLIAHLLHGRALAAMIVVITTLTLLGFVLLITRTYRTSEDLYLSLVKFESSAVERRSELFFKPVVTNLSIIREWGREGIVSMSDEKNLNRFFMPILTQHRAIISMMLVSTSGSEYYLEREGDNWVSYLIKKGSNRQDVTVNRWDPEKRPLMRWVVNMALEDSNPSRYEWYRDQTAGRRDGDIFWTEPYLEHIIKKPVITGSLGWLIKNSDEQYILAFNYLLTSVITSVTSIKPVNDRRVLLATSDDEIIDLSPNLEQAGTASTTADTDALLGKCKDPVIKDAFASWKEKGKPEFQPYRFKSGAYDWWYEFRPLPGGRRNSWIGVIIKESSLLLDVRRQSLLLILLSFIVLIGGSVITILLIKRYRSEIRALREGKKLNPESESEVRALIKKGETSEVEFKSSMRWDYKDGKVNSKLEEVILKSIAAFNNGEGGSLLIGVNDEGEILGIEPDMGTMKEKDKDHFELHLRTMLNNAYGLEYSTNFVKVHFPSINNSQICLVRVKKGDRPLFTCVTDRSGQKVEKFYVRSGNSSREFARMAEAMDYISTRFAVPKKA